MATDPMAEGQASAEQAGDDRGISVGRDASGNAFVTGDNNNVKVVIYQALAERREQEEPTSKEIGPNPYMGLLAFHETEADRFFGREQQTRRLWEKLRDLQSPGSDKPSTRLLPILGPSGSGKSSLARAGLIAELARRPLPGVRDARVAVLTPGAHPLEALAGVLARIATDDSTPVAKTREFKDELKLANDEGACDGLRRIADSLPEIASVPLIVLVDQFEEIYSLCDDNTERIAFIENLLHAASDPSGRTSVVITLRTDFLGETQTHEALNRLICEQQVMVPAMDEAELRAAIAKPAELAGHPLDDATIALLISDAKDREGALPLVQFALTRIWDGLTRGIAPAETYQQIGGVGGALAGEAQRIYDGLGDAEKRIAKRVFLGLVQLGEGTRDTRRRAVVENLVSVGEDIGEVEGVIRRFASRDARLITLSAEEAGAGDTAEVTHEALFAHWDELNGWLDENREDIRFSRRLDEAARIWDQQGRIVGDLWRPPTLDLLREYHTRVGNDMSPLQMDFYIASNQADKAQIAKEKRRQVVLRALLGAAATTALIAIAMLVWALISRNSALEMEKVAQEERTKAQEGRIDALVDAILLAPPKTAGERMRTLSNVAASEPLRDYAIKRLLAGRDRPISEKASPEEHDAMASGKANIGVALLKFGVVEEAWPLLKHSADPALRSYLIHRINQIGADAADAEAIASQLKTEPDPSILQALILIHGEFPAPHYLSGNRESLVPRLVEFYTHDPDPGVHAASEWLLRKWGHDGDVQKFAEQAAEDFRERLDEETKAGPVAHTTPDGKRGWYVNSQGQTMVIIKGPVNFRMGSPESELKRFFTVPLHTKQIDHSFAIAANEVTVAQFLKFREDLPYDKVYGPDLGCPMNTVTWYDAAAYCNWLSNQEGIPEDQWCYRPIAEDKYEEGMKIASECLTLCGYRLPTEVEWEYACRGGSASNYCFGETESLLDTYARYRAGSEYRTWSVGSLKPNGFGLFDMHGNVEEWCHDRYRSIFNEDMEFVKYLKDTHGDHGVVRGGSFFNYAVNVQSGFRDCDHSVDMSAPHIGFRVARTYP